MKAINSQFYFINRWQNNKISLGSDYLKNTLLYPNQTYSTVHKEETAYGGYKILGPVTATPDPSADISNYKRAESEVRIVLLEWCNFRVFRKQLVSSVNVWIPMIDSLTIPTRSKEMLLISDIAKDDLFIYSCHYW